MRQLLSLVAFAALLAGCAGEAVPLDEILARASERDAARCTVRGLEPETAAHQACVERAAAYRDLRRSYRSLATPSVRCTAGSNAGGCF